MRGKFHRSTERVKAELSQYELHDDYNYASEIIHLVKFRKQVLDV